MISVGQSGSFKNLEKFLDKMSKRDIYSVLNSLGARGVSALSAATPVDSGVTASSWDYIIEKKNGRVSITWTNSHVNDGVPIAIILQYGHGTGTGGYVQGRDYINPAIQPVFDEIAEEVWKEVKNS